MALLLSVVCNVHFLSVLCSIETLLAAAVAGDSDKAFHAAECVVSLYVHIYVCNVCMYVRI
jgi:hypothetical protein